MRLNESMRVWGHAVVLVPYCAKHVGKYHAWMQDAELRRATASEALSWEDELSNQRSWWSDERKATFIILDRERLPHGGGGDAAEIDAMVGDVNIFTIDEEDEEGKARQSGELEVMVADERGRRRGLASESLKIMMLFAVQRLRLHSFVVKVSIDNLASLAMFRKLGFEHLRDVAAFDEVHLQKRIDAELRPQLEAALAYLRFDHYHREDVQKLPQGAG